MDIKEQLEEQRNFFKKGATKNICCREKALLRLKNTIKKYEKDVSEALYKDLGKSPYESYSTEIGFVYHEISYMARHMAYFAKPSYKVSNVLNFPSVGMIFKEPYGSVLIMAPWNYPFQLSLVPLIGAVAAGNCAVLKPSNYAPETAGIIRKIIEEAFGFPYVFVVTGGREANRDLLTNRFDYIFFTGGKAVGKIVMEAAAKHLTPVTLELGGKSPCIVDETADIALSARRIVWGKLLNAGQTCVAPDYIYVHNKVKDRLLEALVRNIEALYGRDPMKSKDYCRIINEKHFDRLSKMIEGAALYYGGETDRENLKMAPVIIDNADWDIPAMGEEIFGPILPVLGFEDIGEAIEQITKREKPLALYLFTRSKKNEELVLRSVSFGGGCVNDTVMHLASSNMPFGGVGKSGMGSYHGKYSLMTFSHEKSVLKKSLLMDIPLRYPPYGRDLKLLKMFLH